MSSRLQDLWKQGKPGVGLWCTLDDPRVQELAAQSGFDYLTIDLQHGFNTWSTLCQSISAIRNCDVTVLVRVPANQPDYITRALDAGADGIVVPFVESRADAQKAVNAAYYPTPTPGVVSGKRSYGPLWADYDSGFSQGESADKANQDVICVVQIETEAGVINASEIAEVPGVSVLYVGPYDLALSLGLGGQTYRENQHIHQSIESVIAEANQAGLVAGMHCNGPEMAAYWQNRGANMLTSALDSTTVASAFSTLAAAVKNEVAKNTHPLTEVSS